MNRRAYLDSSKCQCHEDLKKKEEKTSEEKIERLFQTIRDKKC